MKTFLSSLFAITLLSVPTVSSAYFVDHFNYMRRPATPQYIQDPTLDLLPGWPDWIGRLNAFSQYIYGKQYESLTEKQQQVVEKLSKNWPDWIGVPFFLR